MKKRMLWRDIRLTFKKSRGRFLSLVCLLALGAFALVGLKVAGPDMRATAEHFLNGHNLADLTIIGDLGIDADDETVISQVGGISRVEYGYLKDVTVKGTDDAIRVWSTPKHISEFEVVEGCLPQSDSEIAVDADLAKTYAIGSKISFTEKAGTGGATVLTRHTFKVVGVVNSMEIISSVNRGQTQAGTGDLAGYAVISPAVFDVDYHMVARLTFKDAEGLDPFGDTYLHRVSKHKEELENLLADQPAHRHAAVQAQYQDAIDEGQAKVDDARAQLTDAKQKLDDAAAQITDAHGRISGSEKTLVSASGQLAEDKRQLDQGWGQLAAGKTTLEATASQLHDAEKALKSSAVLLQDGKRQLAAKESEYQVSSDQLSSAKNEAERQFDATQTTIEQCRAQLEDGRAAYEQQISMLQQRLEEAQASGGEAAVSLIQKLLDKAQASYDRFLNVDADPDAEGDDGGYAVLTAQLDDSQKQLDEKRRQAEQQFVEKHTQLDQASAQIEAAKQQLAQRQAAYDAGKRSYEQGVSAYNEGMAAYRTSLDAWSSAAQELTRKTGEYQVGVQKLESAKTELAVKEREYQEGLTAYEDALPDAQAQIADGENDLAEAREAQAGLEVPAYNVYTRREAPGSEGYRTYDSVSEIVDSLANIFPYFLYLVAALVASTTMTRMVDEERIGAGTLKALGYDDADVVKKFVVYGATAAVAGTLVGVLLGHTLLPLIVYNAYGSKYDLPVIELHANVAISLACLVLALAVTVLPALLVARRELAEKPAQLLLPKAPAAGSKILLERIRPLWGRLSFMRKVTARNLFRYKKRAAMTVVGVAGAVCLMFAGFGVRYSVSGIAQAQFGDIIDYDLIVAKNAHVSEDEREGIDDLLASQDVKAYEEVTYEAFSKVAGDKGDEQEITLLVPQDAKEFSSYLDLRDRAGRDKIDLPSHGAVISERLAELAGVGVGDTMTFKDANGAERSVEVAGVCEMYINHFMFMSPEVYKEVFDEAAEPNAYVATLAGGSDAAHVAATFMAQPGVKGVVQAKSLANMIDVIVVSLNKITVILIAIATLLAIVIVYNLVTINVSERIRELSTVKVLGFFDNEVSLYIYRETIVLSAIAVPVGWALGRLLQLYIIHAVPPETVMFNPGSGLLPYVISALVIAVVIAVMYLVVKRRLRNVDMLEALKSVD